MDFCMLKGKALEILKKPMRMTTNALLLVLRLKDYT